ncbi:MAG: Hpt domain-containing protein [Hyphomonas sp.]
MSDTAPTPLPLLDKDRLDAMTGGDIDLSLEVVDIFIHQAEIWSRLLDPRADASQWADAAHTLKGASLSIGAMQLANACEIAERAGRSEIAPSVAGSAALLTDVKDLLGETLEAAAKLIHALESSPRKAS